ncbi:MAG: DoxX family protein [Bacteroidales bacterium]
MKLLRTLSRFLVGFVFIYSGFVKGIDPLGSTYKFTEYFLAAHLDFLSSLSLALAIILSAAELLIGMALILRLRMRIAAWAVLCFMSFFTLLTFVSAILNPVSDCGCFGDAIKLTNWQTFFKNIVLMVFVIIIFISRKEYKVKYKVVGEWVFLGIILSGFLLIIRFCYFHLPIIDFLPYKTGTNIMKSMEIPPGAPLDEYNTLLYYEKDGVVKEFTLDNYPWQDSSWRHVETKSIRVKQGYVPPIHDFSISSPDGADITAEVLADPGFSVLMVSHNLLKADREGLYKANKMAEMCASGKCRFYALTASSATDAATLGDTLIHYPFYHTDETTLKTMIRSNPGFIFLKEGTIIGKWSYKDMPDPDKTKDGFLSYVFQYYRHIREQLTNIALWLTLALTIAIIKIVKLNFDRRI